MGLSLYPTRNFRLAQLRFCITLRLALTLCLQPETQRTLARSGGGASRQILLSWGDEPQSHQHTPFPCTDGCGIFPSACPSVSLLLTSLPSARNLLRPPFAIVAVFDTAYLPL